MSDGKIYYLWYDDRDGRYYLSNHDLHCGNCFDVRIGGEWHPTRIEHTQTLLPPHSHGWYLVTHPSTPLDGLAVRKSA